MVSLSDPRRSTVLGRAILNNVMEVKLAVAQMDLDDRDRELEQWEIDIMSENVSVRFDSYGSHPSLLIQVLKSPIFLPQTSGRSLFSSRQNVSLPPDISNAFFLCYHHIDKS